jgi:hypothetical protein
MLKLMFLAADLVLSIQVEDALMDHGAILPNYYLGG